MEPEEVRGLHSDQQIIRKVLDGDRDAFNSLINHYWGLVFRTTMRMINDRAEAEDLTQQTFLEAYQDLSRYDVKRSFRAWLMRIATNNCRDFLRRHQRKELPSGDSGEYAAAVCSSGSPTPEQNVAVGHRISQMLRAVGQMPSKYRVPLMLKEMEDLSYREIQQVTDISPTALRAQVHRARSRLREAMEQVDHPGRGGQVKK